MNWQAVTAKDESLWTEDYLEEVLASHARRPLPPAAQHLGDTAVSWAELDPGVFVVHASGGTVADRELARIIVGTQLRAYGLQPAEFTLGPSLRKDASWADVMEKAQRLRDEGRVQVARNGSQNIVGIVEGDNGTYQTEISRDDPTSNVITTWQCDCPWDQFAWQRTRQWKKYEGRVCSHVLATYWEAQRLPLDMEYDPATGQPIDPNAQFGQGTFTGPGFAPAGPAPRPVGPPPAPGTTPHQPQMQLSIPGIDPNAMAPPPPPGANILPSAPAILTPPPVSVPGAKVPTPENPTQYPGGTFSHVAAKGDVFNNSDMVRINDDEMGIAEGKSVEHGAGEYRVIKKNSIGEVLGQDPTTGWVDVIFPIHDTGPMEPYHIRAWIEPEKLTPMPGIRRPGPFIKRRRESNERIEGWKWVWDAENNRGIIAPSLSRPVTPEGEWDWSDEGEVGMSFHRDLKKQLGADETLQGVMGPNGEVERYGNIFGDDSSPELLEWLRQTHPDAHEKREGEYTWKFAAPFLGPEQYVYHLSPATNRDRILDEGLMVSNPGESGRWDEAISHYPDGIYVWTEEDRALKSAMHTEEPMDVWRIDRGEIRGTRKDPDARDTESFVITNSVPAELHLAAEDRVPEDVYANRLVSHWSFDES